MVQQVRLYNKAVNNIHTIQTCSQNACHDAFTLLCSWLCNYSRRYWLVPVHLLFNPRRAGRGVWTPYRVFFAHLFIHLFRTCENVIPRSLKVMSPGRQGIIRINYRLGKPNSSSRFFHSPKLYVVIGQLTRALERVWELRAQGGI